MTTDGGSAAGPSATGRSAAGPSATGPSAGPPPADEPAAGLGSLLLSATTYVVLVAIGVMLAVVETFLVPQRIFGGFEGLAAILALVVNALIGSLAGIGTRSVSAAITPTVAWLVTVGVLITYAPGGDVVLAGKLGNDPGVVTAGDAYLITGVLAGGVALTAATRFALRATRQSVSG